MDKEKIKKLVLEEKLEITDVIDVVVEVNGIIGVGLITLGDYLKTYCYDKIKEENGKKDNTIKHQIEIDRLTDEYHKRIGYCMNLQKIIEISYEDQISELNQKIKDLQDMLEKEQSKTWWEKLLGK